MQGIRRAARTLHRKGPTAEPLENSSWIVAGQIQEFMRFTAPDVDALTHNIEDARIRLDQALAAGDALASVEHAADLAAMLTTARRETEALDLCRAADWLRLQSFVLHHWARSLVEQERFEEAEACLQEALALRIQLNEPRRESSRRALAALARLREQRP